MYGASLCALDKKDGGIRPIAVGNTFRRLTAKLASASLSAQMSSKFAPRQVGFGIKGGCEAAVHARRTFIKNNSHRKVVVVKIDFRNAFNEVDRDAFLKEMKTNCPAIFPFLWQCYSSPSLLFYGDFILLSQNGAQQGGPCGPLIFSSAIQYVIDAIDVQRLVDLDNYHIAFYILKNCFAIPKLVFLLRTTPTWNHDDTL